MKYIFLNIEQREKLAKNSLDIRILQELFNDESLSVRVRLAYNKNTPEDILFKLLLDKQSIVAVAVVISNITPLNVLRSALNHSDRRIRVWLVKNKNLTKDMLKHLANDLDDFIRKKAIERLNDEI